MDGLYVWPGEIVNLERRYLYSVNREPEKTGGVGRLNAGSHWEFDVFLRLAGS